MLEIRITTKVRCSDCGRTFRIRDFPPMVAGSLRTVAVECWFLASHNRLMNLGCKPGSVKLADA